MKCSENEIDRIKERIQIEIGKTMQILPAYKTCDRCGEHKHITHRIKSEILDIKVCFGCAIPAMRIQEYQGAGKITVEKIT